MVAVILAGTATLWQSRGGCVAQPVVRPGQVIVTPAGGPKRWQHVDDLVALVMRLSRPYLDTLATELDPHGAGIEIQHVLSARDRFLNETAMTFLKALEPKSSMTSAQIASVVRSLGLYLLTRYAVKRESPPSRLLPAMPLRKLRLAVDFIEANLHKDLTVANIAEHVTMSESHFSHVFRKTVGLSPHRYVRDRRIERAKALLRESNMSLSEIAHRVGCSSASNFSVLFHSAAGTTPSTYRNRY